MKVSEVMTRDVRLIEPTQTIREEAKSSLETDGKAARYQDGTECVLNLMRFCHDHVGDHQQAEVRHLGCAQARGRQAVVPQGRAGWSVVYG